MNTLEEILAERQARQSAGDSRSLTTGETDRLISAFTALLAESTVSRNANVQRTEITNHVGDQKVSGEVSVTEMAALLSLVEELRQEVRDSKAEFPDVQKVSGEVTVTNQVTIPDVVFPEYPKRMDATVTQLPKYVGEGLEGIRKAVSSIDVRPEITVKAPDVHVAATDLSAVEGMLAEVSGKMDSREPKLLGFAMRRDRDGSLLSLTETYDTGTVTYDGFKYDEVTVTDGRASS